MSLAIVPWGMSIEEVRNAASDRRGSRSESRARFVNQAPEHAEAPHQPSTSPEVRGQDLEGSSEKDSSLAEKRPALTQDDETS
jgi:hypothetical protein